MNSCMGVKENHSKLVYHHLTVRTSKALLTQFSSHARMVLVGQRLLIPLLSLTKAPVSATLGAGFNTPTNVLMACVSAIRTTARARDSYA